MSKSLDLLPMPQHIAFIMDGNGRWAKARGLPRIEGHRQGVETLENIIKHGMSAGVKHLTFYAFSTENWSRPQTEVDGLMELLRRYLGKKLTFFIDEGVRLKFLGDLSPTGRLGKSLVSKLKNAEDKTAHGQRGQVNICLNYGGRDEVIRAVQQMVLDCQAENLDINQISENSFVTYLDTKDIPDIDLCVRTSGEQRLSNFMLWQVAYAELMFTTTHWPDYTTEEFNEMLNSYRKRDRRFGGIAMPSIGSKC